MDLHFSILMFVYLSVYGAELPCPEGQTSDTGYVSGCKFDPCLQSNYKELDNFKRSVGYNVTSIICDAFLSPGWYRPVSQAGNMMPIECPVNRIACGAYYPIWMNGTYPAEGDTYNITACTSYPDLGCCFEYYDIQVKNCGEFYVYNLVTTVGCDTAFCFGKEKHCPIGETSDNGFTPGCEFDPCQNYAIIEGEYKRSSEYILQDESPIDDTALASGWYRFDSYVGNDLVNSSQELNRCGTIYPVWMMGDIPSDRSRTVNRTCCATGNNDTCESTTFIQIRNCGEFRVYYLPKLEKSQSGFCVGSLQVTTTTNANNELVSNPSISKSTEQKPDDTPWIIAIVCVILCVGCILLSLVVVLKCIRKKTMHTPFVSCIKTSQPPPYKEVMQIKSKDGLLKKDTVNMHSPSKMNIEHNLSIDYIL